MGIEMGIHDGIMGYWGNKYFWWEHLKVFIKQ